MLPNMSRQKKIEALQAIFSGTKIEKVLPVRELMIIEEGNQYWWNDYSIPAMTKPQMDHYIKTCKKKWKDHVIRITRISKSEYDRIVAKLEAEY